MSHSYSPSSGNDGQELVTEARKYCGAQVHDVLVRVAPALRKHSSILSRGDREFRKDLLQEASLEVVRAIDDFKTGVGSLEGYVANRAILHLKNVSRRHVLRRESITYQDPRPTEYGEGLDLADPSTMDPRLGGGDVEVLHVLIAEVLTTREQQVIRVRYFQQLTVTQASTALRISKSRVSQLEGSALAKLRVALQDPNHSLN